jgi:DNA-binding CsgD family transcriptional regulator
MKIVKISIIREGSALLKNGLAISENQTCSFQYYQSVDDFIENYRVPPKILFLFQTKTKRVDETTLTKVKHNIGVAGKFVLVDELACYTHFSNFRTYLNGYVSRSFFYDYYLTIIKLLLAGEYVLSPETSFEIAENVVRLSGLALNRKIPLISEQEKMVLHYVVEGYTNAEIGSELKMPARRVGVCIDRLCKKAMVSDRPALIRWVTLHAYELFNWKLVDKQRCIGVSSA